MMEQQLFEDCLAYRLSQSRKLVAQWYNDHLKPLALTTTAVYAMSILSRAGAATPTQIAKQLDVSKPTVTALLDRMIKAGLIKRDPHSENRKLSIISLSQLGKDKCDAAFAALKKADKKLEDLSQQNLHSLKAELKKLSLKLNA
jgi:DNA-binding MarR family transcriptional regulator